jgi:hypothetical protein
MKQMKRYLGGVVATVFAASAVFAEPVWHCSRNPKYDNVAEAVPSQEDQFSIASFNSSAEVIGVSVRDLIDIYTGTPVRIGGLPLSGCFLTGNERLTNSALSSLGISLNTIEALARKSSIVQNNLFYLTDESEMSRCIAKNSPAVGYLTLPTETDNMMPCF